MKQRHLLSTAVACALIGTSASAANLVADGRGNAMGNTGVTSADYLLAPFYNPALTAVYRDEDDFGILAPAIGFTARDTDESLTTLDDLQDTIEQYEDSGSSNVSLRNDLNTHLDNLSDDKPLAVSVGGGLAVAVPFGLVSGNFYTRGYAEIIAQTDIAESNTSIGDENARVVDRYNNSNVNMAAFGYVEYGVALAKRMTVAGQDFSFGVTPKYQKLTTYSETLTVEDFDLSDYDESETSKSAFNLDLGAVWFYNNFRAGIAIKDLLSQEIETKDKTDKYKLDTQVTISGSYATELLTATLDFDVTTQKRFSGSNDDTRFVRMGVEGNAWGWAQLRAGYEMDMEDTLDNSFTAGLGISPGDLVSIDLAGSYAGDNQFGLSGNLAFTF
ncbi:conjugal transfer protein TraF [Vibrio sinaloensis]|uniref:Conjugal transfer protein TraF n=1 Tax=Photobacterium sp. (strain ATCC 43367) TaxID=379097 RepID=A0A0A5HTM1_PHOS4|nr:conjugal transfer protein TraF [Vibrio sinaloensis]KGY08892.1 conjugal transfer protein TraF [Vibrio sinaloensis]